MQRAMSLLKKNLLTKKVEKLMVDTLAILTQAPNRLEVTQTLLALEEKWQLKQRLSQLDSFANGQASRVLAEDWSRLWDVLDAQLQTATTALTKTQ
jgi:hypothetical protein